MGSAYRKWSNVQGIGNGHSYFKTQWWHWKDTCKYEESQWEQCYVLEVKSNDIYFMKSDVWTYPLLQWEKLKKLDFNYGIDKGFLGT